MNWWREELRGFFILALLLVAFSALFWSPETGLFIVTALGVHEMGHMILIKMTGQESKLAVSLKGIGTVSDPEARATLSEFTNELIHLNGSVFNLIFSGVALYLYASNGSFDAYWLRLANTSALIGFVNLMVIGTTSDGGKYIHRLFDSLSEYWDNVLLVLITFLTILVLIGVAVVKGTSSVVWIVIIAAWIIYSMFQADGHDDGHDMPARPMNRVEKVASFGLYMVVWLLLLVIVVETPFLITDAQAVRIVENFLTLAVITVLNFPMLGFIALTFLAITVPHELGHWGVGLKVGIRTNRFVLGSPSGKPVVVFKIFGTPFEIYRLPILAGVDNNDDDFRKASIPATTVFSLAGPAVNIIQAFIVLVLAVGLHSAVTFIGFIILAMLQLLGAFLFGWLGWFGGSAFYFEAFGVIGAYATSLGIGNWVLVFVVAQVFIAVVNLLPIPGLDGGWILMASVIRTLSRGKTPEEAEKVSLRIYNMWFRFATKRMMATIVVGSAILTVINFGVHYL